MPDAPRPTQSAGMPEPNRRTAVKGMVAASAAALFPILPAGAQHAHPPASASSAAYTPQIIRGTQRDLLTAVCDRIIPRTDTPGAADAGVADEIDWMATRREGLANAVSGALRRVEAAAGRPFTALSPEEQDQVLTRMSSELQSDDGRAFSLLKNLTIDAYYSSKPGLNGELGWDANTYLREFTGCTHGHSGEAGE